MYDALTTTYTFSCPMHGETHVQLSRFRRLEQLPAPSIPRSTASSSPVAAASEHPALVTHDELDWAPLGLQDATPFVNLMTSRVEAVAFELGELAASGSKRGSGRGVSSAGRRSDRGRSFRRRSSCSRPRSATESGLAVRCPVCGKVSVNLVSRAHVDVPFVNDREVGVVRALFDDDAAATLEEFQAELWSASFDARRLTLE